MMISPYRFSLLVITVLVFVAYSATARIEAGWLTDDLLGEEDVEWDVPINTASQSKAHPQYDNGDYEDYEMIDLTTTNEPWMKAIRGLFVFIGLCVGVLVTVVCYYQICIKKKGCTWFCDYCCSCCAWLNPKKVGRRIVQKYMPGIIIHDDDDTVDVYEITQKEQEVLEEIAMNIG